LLRANRPFGLEKVKSASLAILLFSCRPCSQRAGELEKARSFCLSSGSAAASARTSSPKFSIARRAGRELCSRKFCRWRRPCRRSRSEIPRHRRTLYRLDVIRKVPSISDEEGPSTPAQSASSALTRATSSAPDWRGRPVPSASCSKVLDPEQTTHSTTH